MKKIVPVFLCIFYLYTFLFPVFHYANKYYYYNRESPYDIYNEYYLFDWTSSIGCTQDDGLPDEYHSAWKYITDSVQENEQDLEKALDLLVVLSYIAAISGLAMLAGCFLKQNFLFIAGLIVSLLQFTLTWICYFKTEETVSLWYNLGHWIFRMEYPFLRIWIVLMILCCRNNKIMTYLSVKLTTWHRKILLWAIIPVTIAVFYLGPRYIYVDYWYKYMRMERWVNNIPQNIMTLIHHEPDCMIFDIVPLFLFFVMSIIIFITGLIKKNKAPGILSVSAYLTSMILAACPAYCYFLDNPFDCFPTFYGFLLDMEICLLFLLLHIMIAEKCSG